MNRAHFKKIENGYVSAPINQIFKPAIKVGLGDCEIEIKVLKDFHHAANSLHGSIYFKMLDDAAWAASNSYVEDVFLFTYNFNIYLTKPVSKGKIKSFGKMINKTDKGFEAESFLYDDKKNQIGKGSGFFMRSKHLLKDAVGFDLK
tara:strand:+ start:4590 stop:5027 length:438 start_codon:yes stop_codon:yes gene_type:complete